MIYLEPGFSFRKGLGRCFPHGAFAEPGSVD